MKLLKSTLMFCILFVSTQAFALTPIAGDAKLGIIKDGVTIEIKELVFSKEGEYANESVLMYGSWAPRITFYGTGGKKVGLKIGTKLTLRNVKFETKKMDDGRYLHDINADLVSESSAINSYSPKAKFSLFANTIEELRQEAKDQIEIYYAPEDGDIILL